MNPIEITFKFLDEEHKARFWKSNYLHNNGLYIGIVTWDEEYECWEPWGDLTVNLMGTKPGENQAYLDTNNCAPEIITVLEKKGYIKETGIMMPSGFWVYPMVEFSEEFLNGISVEDEGN